MTFALLSGFLKFLVCHFSLLLKYLMLVFSVFYSEPFPFYAHTHTVIQSLGLAAASMLSNPRHIDSFLLSFEIVVQRFFHMDKTQAFLEPHIPSSTSLLSAFYFWPGHSHPVGAQSLPAFLPHCLCITMNSIFSTDASPCTISCYPSSLTLNYRLSKIPMSISGEPSFLPVDFVILALTTFS